MVTIKHPDGTFIDCPTSWRTCSTGVFQSIIREWEPDKEIKDRSVLKLFNLLIGMEVSPEEDDLDLEAAIWECTRFVYQESMDFTKLPVPDQIILNNKLIQFPKDLGRLKIGQNIHVRQALQSVKDPNEVISIVTAIYLQPAFDAITYGINKDESKFDYHRALEVEKIILQQPITLVYPVGFFFLKQLRSYGKGLIPNLKRKIRRKMQDVLILLHWREVKNLLGSLQRP